MLLVSISERPVKFPCIVLLPVKLAGPVTTNIPLIVVALKLSVAPMSACKSPVSSTLS